MYRENDWWFVDHDHVSSWIPKEHWITEQVAGGQWCWEQGKFDFDKPDIPVIKPLRWGFKDKNIALMFALKWS
jgi:hypothetical protein